jgi:hypothetical protein
VTVSDALDSILARARGDAEALRRHGDARLAASLEAFADAVAASPELQMLAWISEARAMTRSGYGQRYFREHRAGWEARGLARRTPKGWQYRVCALPNDVGEAEADDAGVLADRLLGRAS